MSDSSFVTFDYLNEISGGDTEFQKEIVQTFLEEMGNEIRLLQEATASTDWTSVGSLAHKIKAPINMLCTTPLKNRVLFIEKSAKAGEALESLPGEVAALVADLEIVMTELRAI